MHLFLAEELILPGYRSVISAPVQEESVVLPLLELVVEELTVGEEFVVESWR